MKLEMDMYYLIRSYHNDGMSIRAIAQTLDISRQTVKKYCDGTTIPGNRKEYHRNSTIITDETREFILSCFREDEQEGLAKQRHTAKRIYDRLVAEKGFAGGESTISVILPIVSTQYPLAQNALKYLFVAESPH